MVMHLSCSSFLVSVNLVSPARAEAMMPALHTRESVRVDFPWSTWAITDMFLMLDFLSMISRIWSTVKFTWGQKIRLIIRWHLPLGVLFYPPSWISLYWTAQFSRVSAEYMPQYLVESMPKVLLRREPRSFGHINMATGISYLRLTETSPLPNLWTWNFNTHIAWNSGRQRTIYNRG